MGNLEDLEKFYPIKSEENEMRPFVSDTDLQMSLTARSQASDEPNKGFDFPEIYKKAKESTAEVMANSTEMKELAEDFEALQEISNQLVYAYKELINPDPKIEG